MTKAKIDVGHVSKLANLDLTESEKKSFEKQLAAVIDYISELGKLDTDKVEPIGHITGLENVSREDKTAPSLSQKEAIKNAPKTHNGLFLVDSIFQEE